MDDPDLTIPMETSPDFVDREEFMLQRYKKLKAETLIKEEQAEIEKLKKQKLRQDLISIEEVESTIQIIAANTKSRLKRVISELPPRLEGLTANEMIPIVRDCIDSVLEDLHSESQISE